ncbi:Pentatricopeptide repeat-containing protein [Platanthera guangdongensis]|uniref:Pentatricopeptide repeat-containing protein n=1 Tax=Platanthera guangdongensis TaxID=2320717 RepID=A0ABR2LEU4_9ASPA
MSMAKTAGKLLSWGLPASRRLCASSAPVVSTKVTETEALSEFRPLFRRLSALGATPGGSVEKTMKEWQREGKKVTAPELMSFIRQFRRYKSYKTALELMDWMESNGIKLSSSGHAVRLDLVAKSKGVEEAENYFANLPKIRRNHQTFGALLSVYCQRKMPDKAISLYDKMRELNISRNTLTYNNLMALHMKLGSPEKIHSLYEEMKASSVPPDVFTHCHLMNSFASMNDIDSVESFGREIEKNFQGSLNWRMYTNMASHFIAAGRIEKAESSLKKVEETMDVRDRECYHYLITMYAGVGNLAEVTRIWKFLKVSFTKTTNKSFMVMFHACIKLDEMDTLKQCYDEWKCNCLCFDIRLPCIAMAAYLRKDMVKEVEYILDNVMERGYGNGIFSWGAFIGYHLRKKEMDLALKSLKFTACCRKQHQWSPKKELVKDFFVCFEEAKDVERAEALCKILKDINCVDMDVYEFLLRTYMAAGRKDCALRQRIEEDGFELSAETERLLERVTT